MFKIKAIKVRERPYGKTAAIRSDKKYDVAGTKYFSTFDTICLTDKSNQDIRNFISENVNKDYHFWSNNCFLISFQVIKHLCPNSKFNPEYRWIYRLGQLLKVLKYGSNDKPITFKTYDY